MSHYAKLIAPLKANTVVTRECITLEVNTPIKGVSLNNGVYTFEAALHVGKRSSGWVIFRTQDDLPAFTDKGSAQRAAPATLRPGRPTGSSSKATRRLVCKVTDEQATAVEAIAEKEETNVPGLIRKALIERGMPE